MIDVYDDLAYRFAFPVPKTHWIKEHLSEYANRCIGLIGNPDRMSNDKSERTTGGPSQYKDAVLSV